MFQTRKTNPKLTTAKTQDQTSKLANWEKQQIHKSNLKTLNSQFKKKNKNRKVGKILNRKSQT